jgi:hypothetical protein
VILAEPVGSCTDLVATVVQPLKGLYGDRFQVAPYPVLFKPEPRAAHPAAKPERVSSQGRVHLHQTARRGRRHPHQPRDELTAAELDELAALVSDRYSGTPALRVSARTGQGFDALTALLDQEGDFGRKILDIDYDTYAEGEAELGWLNSSVHVSTATPFALDDFLLEVVRGYSRRWRDRERRSHI